MILNTSSVSLPSLVENLIFDPTQVHCWLDSFRDIRSVHFCTCDHTQRDVMLW